MSAGWASEVGVMEETTGERTPIGIRSLAEVVGVTLEGEHAGRRISQIEEDCEDEEGSADDHQGGRLIDAGDGASTKPEEGEGVEIGRSEDAVLLRRGDQQSKESRVATEHQQNQQITRHNPQSSMPMALSLSTFEIPTPFLTLTPDTPVHREGLTSAGGDSKQPGLRTSAAVEFVDANQQKHVKDGCHDFSPTATLYQQKRQPNDLPEQHMRPHEVTQ